MSKVYIHGPSHGAIKLSLRRSLWPSIFSLPRNLAKKPDVLSKYMLTTEQPHSTGVHDAIGDQRCQPEAASRLLVSSIGGTQWTVACAWLVLFLCDGRWSSSCHAGCCIGVLVCLPTCPVQRLIRALKRPYQTFFKVLFEAHDGPRTMLVAQRVSQRASRQGSR